MSRKTASSLRQKLFIALFVLLVVQVVVYLLFSSQQAAKLPVAPHASITTETSTSKPQPATKASTDATPSPGALTASDQDQLLEVLTKDSDERLAHYDPTHKRDPFKPLKIASDSLEHSNKSPLEIVSLDKLSYSAYIQADEEPKAIIENADGRGFTVSKGSKVGTNNGVITDILPDRIIVVESTVDFTGATQTKTFEFVIGVKGAKSNRKN